MISVLECCGSLEGKKIIKMSIFEVWLFKGEVLKRDSQSEGNLPLCAARDYGWQFPAWLVLVEEP